MLQVGDDAFFEVAFGIGCFIFQAKKFQQVGVTKYGFG
jgi:hypothetical protein